MTASPAPAGAGDVHGLCSVCDRPITTFSGGLAVRHERSSTGRPCHGFAKPTKPYIPGEAKPAPPAAPREPAQLPAVGETLLSVRAVADMFAVSKMTVYRLIEDGSLRALRIGRNYRINSADAADYIRRASTR